MNDFRYWTVEFWLIIIIVIMTVMGGVLTGYLGEFIFIFVTGYLLWHLRQIYRLRYWLNRSRSLYPPEAMGIWNDIFHNIFLLQKRNRKSRKRLTRILNEFRLSTAALPDGAVVLDQRSEIVWFNKSAEILLDLNPRKDIGQRITNLIRFPKFIEFESQDSYSLPLEMPSPHDNNIHLSVRIVPYSKNQRLLIARNITRLHHLEKVRKDFVANVSHELRSPLTVISGYIELMRDAEEQLPKQYHKPLKHMEDQVTRMNSLVDDLLTLSQLESGSTKLEKQTINVAAVLERIEKDAQDLSQNKHQIELLIETHTSIEGHEKEIESAFSNLIFNAIRYTPEGGKITISWIKTQEYLEMSVRDTGPGIEAAHIPRLTERFYRVDNGRSRKDGGTGLGLAIVKHVLERHDAGLSIESEVGKGSEFKCLFPLQPFKKNL